MSEQKEDRKTRVKRAPYRGLENRKYKSSRIKKPKREKFLQKWKCDEKFFLISRKFSNFAADF